ncbi:MAG: metallophosphoesterase [archaeon]|nr:metallophosphoesterase [archaeon]
MKILCLSDLHGRFPNKLHSFAKEGKFDLILVAGDITESETLRKLQFDNWNKLHSSKKTIEDIVGKREFKRLLKASAVTVIKTLKKLNNLEAPVIIISGNSDNQHGSLAQYKLSCFEIENVAQQFKNIVYVDKTFIEIEDISIITHGGYRGVKLKKSPGQKIGSLKYSRHKKQYIKELTALFKNMKHPENTIFLTHDVPFNIDMDLVKLKTSPMYGRHVGDELYRLFIEKYSPAINICGHMHENQGKELIKKTIIANCGYGHDGQCCVLKMKDKKTAVRFYKL